MKEQIHKIFDETLNVDEDGTLYGEELCIEKITSHIMDFIWWLEFGNHGFYAWDSGMEAKCEFYKNEYNPIETREKIYTLEEVYQYWFNNVKNAE